MIDHLASCTKLSRLGCKIFGDTFNHSKGIISNETGMIFTANIDGYHGLKNGFEVGVLLDIDTKNVLESFLKWQIESAPYKFSLSPSKKDYFDSYSFFCHEKGINAKEMSKNITVKVLEENKHLIEQIDTTPCYLKVKNNQIIQLQIGENSYYADYKENILSIRNKTNSLEYNLESYLLQYENMNIIFE